MIHPKCRYATIENILVQYGGLRRENDTEFTTGDKVLEAYIRANGTELIQIPVEVIHIVTVQTIPYQRIRKCASNRYEAYSDFVPN